jgi:hypothetical protein
MISIGQGERDVLHDVPELLHTGAAPTVRRPADTRRRRLSRRLRHPYHYRWFWLKTALVALATTLVAGAGWLTVRTVQLLPVARDLKSGATTLDTQARAGDFAGVAATMAGVRADAARADRLTHDPVWAVAAWLPVVGDDVTAARRLARSAAEVTAAARPLESAIPRILGAQPAGALVDPAALKDAAVAMPALSAAVDSGVAALADVRTDGVVDPLGSAVEQVRTLLGTLRGPLDSGGPALETFADLLGAAGPRTTVVLLQQDAEARGTGGLVGAYALLRADRGEVTLLETHPRPFLDAGPKIPQTAVPQELRDLWNTDLEEWAGLNLSPHFPWTGQLVAAGWALQPGLPPIDNVVAIDQNVFAALLAGTGPVEADGLTLTPKNAAQYLAQDIYVKHPASTDVDLAVGRLVEGMFGRLAKGDLAVGPLVTAMREPVAQRRVLLWSRRQAEQQLIERTAFSGAIPDRPGPFVMPVINNGGGNKLDAYLETSVDYDPGECADGVRLGTVDVTLTNIAPDAGLPEYVVGDYRASNLKMRDPVAGQNRVLLDLYGPVGASAPVILLDGEDVTPLMTGIDRNHPVWRVAVPLPPGTSRTLEYTIVQDATPQDAPTATVLTQPMVRPVAVTVRELTGCSAG